jgi:RecA-family ATPase
MSSSAALRAAPAPVPLQPSRAERMVLGSLFQGGDFAAYQRVAATLPPRPFSSEPLNELWRALGEMAAAGAPYCVPSNVEQQYRQSAWLPRLVMDVRFDQEEVRLVGLDVLKAFAEEAVTSVNIAAHAAALRAEHFERVLPDRLAAIQGMPILEARAALRDLAANEARLNSADASPLFHAEDFRFSRYLESEPAPRRMLLPDLLPLGIVGLQAATGGTGKSFLLYSLGLSIATGCRFLGMTVEEVGGVLYLSAEDDDAELHRRGRRILQRIEQDEPVSRSMMNNLVVVPMVGEDTFLTAVGPSGELARTRLVDRLVAAARRIPDLKLIVLDPASRFRGGKENEEQDAKAFIGTLEAIATATQATVLAAAHVNKGSIRGGDDLQSAIRGSSALVDNSRWSTLLHPIHRNDWSKYNLKAEDARRIVRLDLVKTNYTGYWPGMWLRKEAGGVLVPTTLEGAEPEHRGDTQYRDVLGRVSELIRREGPMTSSRIEKEYAGREGFLRAGQKMVRGILSRAVLEGDLVEQQNPGKGGGAALALPGGTA